MPDCCMPDCCMPDCCTPDCCTPDCCTQNCCTQNCRTLNCRNQIVARQIVVHQICCILEGFSSLGGAPFALVREVASLCGVYSKAYAQYLRGKHRRMERQQRLLSCYAMYS